MLQWWRKERANSQVCCQWWMLEARTMEIFWERIIIHSRRSHTLPLQICRTIWATVWMSMGSIISAMELCMKVNLIKVETYMETESCTTPTKRHATLVAGTPILSMGSAPYITNIQFQKIPIHSLKWPQLTTRISDWITAGCGHITRESLIAIRKMGLAPCTCAMEINSADVSSMMSSKVTEPLPTRWQTIEYQAYGKTTFSKSEKVLKETKIKDMHIKYLHCITYPTDCYADSTELNQINLFILFLPLRYCCRTRVLGFLSFCCFFCFCPLPLSASSTAIFRHLAVPLHRSQCWWLFPWERCCQGHWVKLYCLTKENYRILILPQVYLSLSAILLFLYLFPAFFGYFHLTFNFAQCFLWHFVICLRFSLGRGAIFLNGHISTQCRICFNSDFSYSTYFIFVHWGPGRGRWKKRKRSFVQGSGCLFLRPSVHVSC